MDQVKRIEVLVSAGQIRFGRGRFETCPYSAYRAKLPAGLLLVLTLFIGNCVPRRSQPVIPFEQLTAERLVEYLKTRGAALQTLEAKIEIDGSGLTPPLPKLFGALRIIRQGQDLHVQVQAYLPLGAPAFELLAQGENFQLFVPGEGRCYTNSVALLFGRTPNGTVTDLFAAAGFPARLFYDQLGLLFGDLPQKDAKYQLAQESDRLVLEESIQGVPARRIFLNRRDLSFLRLEDGEAQVDFEARSRPRRDEFFWLPRRLTFSREGLAFRLTLTQVQVNARPQAAIQFRDPGRLSLYLAPPPEPDAPSN